MNALEIQDYQNQKAMLTTYLLNLFTHINSVEESYHIVIEKINKHSREIMFYSTLKKISPIIVMETIIKGNDLKKSNNKYSCNLTCTPDGAIKYTHNGDTYIVSVGGCSDPEDNTFVSIMLTHKATGQKPLTIIKTLTDEGFPKISEWRNNKSIFCKILNQKIQI